MTRRDLVKAISPSRTGSDKSQWNPYELSRPRATKVVKIFFDPIAAALRKGEMVTLPIGTFEVLEHTRPPLRRWVLKQKLFRVTYAKRKYVKFTPSGRLMGQVWWGKKERVDAASC